MAEGSRQAATAADGSIAWRGHAIEQIQCLLDLDGSVAQTTTQRAPGYRRIVLESCRELGDLSLDRYEDPKQIRVPPEIHPRIARRRLERVSAHIYDDRPSRRLPVGGVDAAFRNRKVDLPVVVADSVQIPALVKIEDLVTRALLLLPLEERQEIVAVEVLLEDSVAELVALGHLAHDVWVAGGREQRRHPVLVGDDVVVN